MRAGTCAHTNTRQHTSHANARTSDTKHTCAHQSHATLAHRIIRHSSCRISSHGDSPGSRIGNLGNRITTYSCSSDDSDHWCVQRPHYPLYAMTRVHRGCVQHTSLVTDALHPLKRKRHKADQWGHVKHTPLVADTSQPVKRNQHQVHHNHCVHRGCSRVRCVNAPQREASAPSHARASRRLHHRSVRTKGIRI